MPPDVILDFEFFEDLSSMSIAAEGGGVMTQEVENSIGRVQRSLEGLFAGIENALAPILGQGCISPMPSLASTRKYVTKGSSRLDYEMRFHTGGWQSKVKVIVGVVPWGVEAYLTSWMASRAESESFARFLSAEGDKVREELVELSRSIEDRGLALQLKESVRVGSEKALARGWPDATEDWSFWRTNALGQAGVGLWLHVASTEAILAQCAEQPAENAFEIAGRALGGLEGRRLALGSSSSLASAVAEATQERLDTIQDLIATGQLAQTLIEVAAGLAELLHEFRTYEERRILPSGRSTPFTSSALEIANEILRSATSSIEGVPSHAVNDRELAVRGNEDEATIGWATKDEPWLVVQRPEDGTVRLAFHATEKQDRYDYKRRAKQVAALQGQEGVALIDLIRASGGNVAPTCGLPECGEKGSCPVNSRLVDHWLVRGPRPVLEWVIASHRGQVDWLSAPAAVLGPLLLQGIPHPPELIVPSVEMESWDIFLSTPGTALGSLGGAVAEALRGERLSTWFMADHQAIGTGIDENTRRAIQASATVVAILHSSYWESSYCVAEFVEAARLGKEVIPIVANATGDPCEVADQLAMAEAGITEHSSRPPADTQRAVELVRELLGPTIRAGVAESASSLSHRALNEVAGSVRQALPK